MSEQNQKIIIEYVNFKGEKSERKILPIEIWFGNTRRYKDDQWFLKALDFEKGDERNFRFRGIEKFSPKQITDTTTPQQVSQPNTIGSVKEVKLFTDGGSRGNPGPSAIGFAIYDKEDNLLFKESKYLGITTNNQAEYQGLKQGLEFCHKNGFTEVDVFMDSLLVVNQMKGIFKVKNRDLWPIYDSAKQYISNFKRVSFSHVPRELNKMADSMVNECLDNQID